MLKRRRVAVAVALLITAIPVYAGARPKMGGPESARKEIRAVLDNQVQAWNRGDLEGFMRGYWRSPSLTFFSGGTTVSGWEETLGRYSKRYQGTGNEMGKLEFLDLNIELLGPSAAFVRGRFHLKMSSGESMGLFTLTFRKIGGAWKIIHDHTSTA